MPSPTALTLVIANKNYSSWSARAWLTMTALKIPFTKRMVSSTQRTGIATFDTIAILERLHELFPSAVWPPEPHARARARALVADFHAGYQELRSAVPMNIRSRYPGKGMSPKVAAEIDHLCAHWREAKARFRGSGPFLFGDFCAADAFFTPVASRFLTYGVPLGGCGETLPGGLARHTGHADLDRRRAP